MDLVHLRTGNIKDHFCKVARMPSCRERLQRRVKKGRRSSINSGPRKVGRGSNSQDFEAQARMRLHSSEEVTCLRTERQWSVTENRGGGEPKVSARP